MTPPTPVHAAEVPARTLRVALSFAISLFFIWGLAYGLLDVLNKHFQDTLHVGTAQSTWPCAMAPVLTPAFRPRRCCTTGFPPWPAPHSGCSRSRTSHAPR